MRTDRVSRAERLIALFAAPALWTLHLFASYFVVALACNTGWGGATVLVTVITVLLAAAAITSGVYSLRSWRRVQRTESWEHAVDEAGGEEGLLMLVGVMMAMLFAPLILLNGITPFLVPVCAP